MFESPGDAVESRRATIGGVVPILSVANLDTSITYYVAQLGFELQWRNGVVASVRRDRTSVMLCEGDQGHAGTWLWIAASDVDALYAEFEARGARLRHAPANYPWGSRECQITDPDGHVLRFGADLRGGEPMGDWLDGSGRRWMPVEGGGGVLPTDYSARCPILVASRLPHASRSNQRLRPTAAAARSSRVKLICVRPPWVSRRR